MNSNKPIAGLGVLLSGALIVGAGAAAGSGVWLLQRRTTASAERRARLAEASVRTLERRVDELESELSSAGAAMRRTGASEDVAAQPENEADAKPAPKTEKHIGYVLEVLRDGGDVSLVVDYAELLTGEDASSAHEADGLGPIDGEQYYIRNVNAKKRTLRVADDATVVVWSWFAETEDVGAKEISLERFTDAMPGGASPSERLSELPYWFTVRGDKIVRIEEQFLP